ncbi:MAG: PD40 domain-containing protein [Planctomycetes bacterium]|nr:PD40 domain-containing protein [Planctomycetota bacterium]
MPLARDPVVGLVHRESARCSGSAGVPAPFDAPTRRVVQRFSGACPSWMEESNVNKPISTVLFVACAAAFVVAPSPAQLTVRVSTGPTNFQGNFNSLWGVPSADGRYVAFHSFASNLVLSDLNGHLPDVFVKDRQTFGVTMASTDSAGAQANGGSIAPSMSADARFVAFESDASNLVLGDTNGVRDVFVKDLATGVTVRASVDSAGVQGSGPSYLAAIAPDGTWVAFESDASELVAGDTNGARDVFLHELATGITLRASVDSSGVEGNGASTWASVSSNGLRVAFESLATNLVAVDTNAAPDVFVYERATGTTTRVAVGVASAQGDGASGGASISADGRIVAFWSDATNLVVGDTNGVTDVFARDLLAQRTERVSVGVGGAQATGASTTSSSCQVSADGRWISFDSWASNLVAGDTNNATDCFVHDLWTRNNERVDVTTAGAQVSAGASAPSISANGRFVAMASSSSTLVTGDNNNYWDVFLRDRGALPATIGFCFGDGSEPAETTLCPCANFGAFGHGCANSVNTAGGFLGTTGATATDDVVLRGSGMPATAACIYLQGDALADVVFGDGVRCTGGALLRLRTKVNAAGLSAFPDSTDTITLSARGGVVPGSGARRWYQTYYRNASAAFCPPETFNVTNGTVLDW